MDRVLVIDKPAGLTSHDVVQRVRRALRMRRVGHAGTLDPSATGVLVILVGRATRLSEFLTAGEKTYEGRFVLGSATDTHDADGVVVGTGDFSGVTEECVLECLRDFSGDLMQVPPMVSAVKRGGRPLYQLAREGIEVERDARPISVRDFTLVRFSPPDVWFRVTCTKGTYVRTLAADIGEALGCGAHLGELRRTRSGDFTLNEAVALGELADPAKRATGLGRSLFDALAELPAVTLAGRQLESVLEGQGAVVDGASRYPEGSLVRATPDGVHLTAIARVEVRADDGVMSIKPTRVFAEGDGEEPEAR